MLEPGNIEPHCHSSIHLQLKRSLPTLQHGELQHGIMGHHTMSHHFLMPGGECSAVGGGPAGIASQIQEANLELKLKRQQGLKCVVLD